MNPINFFKTIRRFFREAINSHYKRLGDKLHVFRILCSLYLKAKFYKSSGPICQKLFGYEVHAFDHYSLMFLFREIFIRNEYFFKCEQRVPKIMDCGANIGMAILFFKQIYPEAHITAFEPNPKAFELLKKNVAANKLKDVTLYNLALSNSQGTLNFYSGNDTGGLVGSALKNRGGSKVTKVKCEKLSGYMKNENFDLVKMDVEGSEHQVISDLKESGLLNKANRYLIEYHHLMGNDKPRMSDFLAVFEMADFNYNIRAGFSTSGSFQDILLNVYKPVLTDLHP